MPQFKVNPVFEKTALNILYLSNPQTLRCQSEEQTENKADGRHLIHLWSSFSRTVAQFQPLCLGTVGSLSSRVCVDRDQARAPSDPRSCHVHEPGAKPCCLLPDYLEWNHKRRGATSGPSSPTPMADEGGGVWERRAAFKNNQPLLRLSAAPVAF